MFGVDRVSTRSGKLTCHLALGLEKQEDVRGRGQDQVLVVVRLVTNSLCDLEDACAFF